MVACAHCKPCKAKGKKKKKKRMAVLSLAAHCALWAYPMATIKFKVGMTCGGCEGAIKCVH